MALMLKTPLHQWLLILIQLLRQPEQGHEWQQNETAHPHQPTHAATPAPRSCSVAGSSIRAQRSSADGRAPARRVRWRADLVGPQVGTSLPPIRRRIQARDAEEPAGDPVPTARIHPDDQPDCDRPHRRTGIKVSDDELAAVNITPPSIPRRMKLHNQHRTKARACSVNFCTVFKL